MSSDGSIKARTFLMVFLRERVRAMPRAGAVEKLGDETYERLFAGRFDHLSARDLMGMLALLGVPRRDVIEAARFHSGLSKRFLRLERRD